MSLITGEETLEELRNMIVELSEACPSGWNQPHSPFQILSGLSYASLTNLVKNLPRESCLNLFELELESRSQAESLGRVFESRGTVPSVR